jgi:glycosyltransferase involved in cell wall biosynthesis
LKTILVSVSNDLTFDQRVQKVCNTLHKSGFSIHVIGRKQKNSNPAQFDYKVELIQPIFNKGFLFYVEFNIRLFFKILVTKKDILLANDLDTLLPNQMVSRLQSKKLVFDSHELFSEIPELVDRPFIKSIWKRLENSLIPRQQYGITVSSKIADFYNERYNVDFITIKNFPNTDVNFDSTMDNPFGKESKPIIIYQGALNVGRGLELMIDGMEYLSDYKLILIGDGDIRNDLKKRVVEKNLQNQIEFIGKVHPKVLKKVTPFASIGISLEEDLGLNYRFAMPNKIFDYIQAGIPVLISDLPEMKIIVENFEVGEVVKSRNPKELASQIKLILQKDFSAGLEEAGKELIWENQERELLRIFQ